MRVIKFGGTSVQNADRITTVLHIAATASRAPGGAVLVSSALSGTTSQLLQIADLAKNQQREQAAQLVEDIRRRHLGEAAQLLRADSTLLQQLNQQIQEIVSRIASLLEGILLLRECSGRTRDALVSCGEFLATAIIAAAAVELKMESEWLDARKLICTDNTFGSAQVDFAQSDTQIQTIIQPNQGHLYITQGFIGSTAGTVTTTLGRGGSDYSAAIIASALGAEALEIWTDVDGIMTTDPRIVPQASRIPAMSYSEAAELAYFGAKVVHPSTMQPVVTAGIPIYVRNTHNQHSPGTVISNEKRALGLRAIAEKKEITVITVQSSRMLHAYGFMQNLFSVFARNRIAVDLVATSEVSVSVTIDPAAVVGDLDTALHELKELGETVVETGMSIICLVGHDLWKDASFVARVFSSLKTIPVRLISLGSSDVNLSLVVPEEYRTESVRRIHQEFFPPAEPNTREALHV